MRDHGRRLDAPDLRSSSLWPLTKSPCRAISAGAADTGIRRLLTEMNIVPVVVGAGIGGLTAARALADPQKPVRLPRNSIGLFTVSQVSCVGTATECSQTANFEVERPGRHRISRRISCADAVELPHIRGRTARREQIGTRPDYADNATFWALPTLCRCCLV
jgi:hypothetical protein